MNGLEYLAISFILVIGRVGGFVMAFPMFRSGTIPRLIKVSLTVALSTMWLSTFLLDSAAPMPPPFGQHWVSYGIATTRELILGAILGYLLGLLFLPAQIAGSYLGQELGFNMAGLTDPATDSQSNVFGDFLNALAMLMFLAVDAHQLAIGALYASFARLPIGQPLPKFELSLVSVAISNAHRWGMELSAPLAVALFLVTVVTAMLMKISPQLNLFAIGIPVRLFLGLVASLIFFPDMAHILARIFQQQSDVLRDLGF